MNVIPIDSSNPPRPLGGSVRFREALAFWCKLGLISFGGPAGQIAIMHEEVVVRRRWISEAEFSDALNFCMLLPGPEAQQLATYLGWLLHRTKGALAAGILFVAPSALLLWLISWSYVTWGSRPSFMGVLVGLKAAVLAVVILAILRLGKRSLRTLFHACLALTAFLGLWVGNIPFPWLVLGAAVLGGLRQRLSGSPPDVPSPLGPTSTGHWARSGRVLGVGAILWWSPVLALGFVLGWSHVLVREGVFFAKAALVTFGGAYAVLPYVAQQAVEQFGWLTGPQMTDGLAFAETTPGPLIMVLQFVGFMGGWNHPGTLPPLVAATLGAAITTWTTFVPSFIWILLGAPYLAQRRRHPVLEAALAAVTAAVVGVILHLAVWFALETLRSGPPTQGWLVAGLAVLAGVALSWGRCPVPLVVLGCGMLGFLLRSLGVPL
ncbi:MAG: chromate efflux transporter [Verrucomicrobiales bacterium]|nr:chromate efflux transporter [Verrucomicrobiales bacterium]